MNALAQFHTDCRWCIFAVYITHSSASSELLRSYGITTREEASKVIGKARVTTKNVEFDAWGWVARRVVASEMQILQAKANENTKRHNLQYLHRK